MEINQIIKELTDFATRHDIELETEGEVGIGRECVGFLKNVNYIDYNPCHSKTYEPIQGFQDDRLYAPDDVNAYHKHDCLAVLVNNGDYAKGLVQLHKWIKHIDSQGEVEIVQYSTGAAGMQAMFTGSHGYAIKFK